MNSYDQVTLKEMKGGDGEDCPIPFLPMDGYGKVFPSVPKYMWIQSKYSNHERVMAIYDGVKGRGLLVDYEIIEREDERLESMKTKKYDATDTLVINDVASESQDILHKTSEFIFEKRDDDVIDIPEELILWNCENNLNVLFQVLFVLREKYDFEMYNKIENFSTDPPKDFPQFPDIEEVFDKLTSIYFWNVPVIACYADFINSQTVYKMACFYISKLIIENPNEIIKNRHNIERRPMEIRNSSEDPLPF